MEATTPLVLESPGESQFAIVWLHGLGADGTDLVPVAQELNLSPQIRIRHIFPHAPVIPVTVNGGYRMRAWYDIRSSALDQDVDLPAIEASRKALEALLAREKERGIPSSRTFVGGFSQGGVMALELAAHSAEPLAGAIVLSAYLADPSSFPPARHNTPVFQAHGTFDPIVPLHQGERCRDRLRELGYGVEWHTYAMQHSIDIEEIRALAVWAQARVAAL